MAKKIKYSDQKIGSLLESIWEGKVNPYFLPKDLYSAIADNLKSGLYEGYGANLDNVEALYGLKAKELLVDLRENIYQFAAAKTFHQVEEMSSLLVGGLTFDDFKVKALEIFGKYNESWLETEYNTAIGQAEMARKWDEVEKQKEIFPYLKYNAVNDSHTSDICRPLDNIIRPVGDKFWSEFSPLNHFNCRCVIEQLETPNG